MSWRELRVWAPERHQHDFSELNDSKSPHLPGFHLYKTWSHYFTSCHLPKTRVDDTRTNHYSEAELFSSDALDSSVNSAKTVPAHASQTGWEAQRPTKQPLCRWWAGSPALTDRNGAGPTLWRPLPSLFTPCVSPLVSTPFLSNSIVLVSTDLSE